MNTLTERLAEYMKYKDLNYNQVTQQAGLSVGLLSKAIRTNKGLHSDSVEKIINTYKDLNPQWLLSGNGSMIIESSKEAKVTDNSEDQLTKVQKISLRDDLSDSDKMAKIFLWLLFSKYKKDNNTSFDFDGLSKLSEQFEFISLLLKRLQDMVEVEALLLLKSITKDSILENPEENNIVIPDGSSAFLDKYKSIYEEFAEYDKELFDILLIAADKIPFLENFVHKMRG